MIFEIKNSRRTKVSTRSNELDLPPNGADKNNNNGIFYVKSILDKVDKDQLRIIESVNKVFILSVLVVCASLVTIVAFVWDGPPDLLTTFSGLIMGLVIGVLGRGKK